MDPERIATDIIPGIRNKGGDESPPVYLSIPSVLSKFHWASGSLELLIEKLIAHALEINHPARGIRIAVREKGRMSDLEQFFSIFPLYWFQTSIEIQAASGFDIGARRILEDCGYRCPEWIEVESSESHLGAFYFGIQETPPLILFIQNHGARLTCDILIPVTESVSSSPHAI